MPTKRSILPYGDSVSAPAIKLPDIELFKTERGTNAAHYLNTKIEELNKEFKELVDIAQDTDLVYSAQIRLEPKVGNIYHLYDCEKDGLILSIIEPNEWNKTHVGSFLFTADNVWKRVD
jgi:hypothetical protein